ncbi:MAG: TIGR02281 family clan AA aspartic protease, partial [Gammaproteobacteria bacterium]
MNDTDQTAASTKTIGRGMVIAAWIILLLLLTVFFNDHLDRQNNPNRQLATITTGGTPEVQLQRNRHGHYVASGSINGPAVDFMLDTG